MVLGGTVAALSHGLKSGTRALINTSPRPASNWTASIAEERARVGHLALAVAHPLWALALLVRVATIAFIVSIVLLYRLARHVARRVRAAVA